MGVVDKEWVVQVVVVVLAVSSLKLATALMATLANSTTVVTQLLPTPTVDKANATISLRLAPVNSVTHADSLTRTKRRSCLCCNDMGDASCHAAGEMGLY